jgi:two-component system, NarL family, response regulator NreC
MTIKVLLLDDHAMVREGLGRLLATQADIEVVGSFSDATEAVRFCAATPPDVAVLDILLPGLDGIEAARLMHDASAETRLLILSMHASSEYVYQALRAGASGYVLKESAGAELIEAIRAVHAGKTYMSGKISPGSLAQYVSSRADHPLDRITQRERQVLKLIVEGYTSNDVGKMLSLSPKSVDTYRSRLMLKLGISDLPGLVKFAIRHGLTTV